MRGAKRFEPVFLKYEQRSCMGHQEEHRSMQNTPVLQAVNVYTLSPVCVCVRERERTGGGGICGCANDNK